MTSELSTDQWNEILSRQDLTKETGLKIFQALYLSDGHKAPASQIGRQLGYEGKSPHAPLNSEIGRMAKRIAKCGLYDIQFTERSSRKYKYWDLFFNGENEGNFFVWQLKPELAKALEECKLIGEQSYPEDSVVPEDDESAFPEGRESFKRHRHLERDGSMPQKAKAKRLAEVGKLECDVCGLDFHRVYGDLGYGFIEAHHKLPVSEIKGTTKTKIADLALVCSNCHRMLHRGKHLLSVADLKRRIHE